MWHLCLWITGTNWVIQKSSRMSGSHVLNHKQRNHGKNTRTISPYLLHPTLIPTSQLGSHTNQTCVMAKNQGRRSSRSRIKYTIQDPGFPRSRVKYIFQDPGFPRSHVKYYNSRSLGFQGPTSSIPFRIQGSQGPTSGIHSRILGSQGPMTSINFRIQSPQLLNPRPTGGGGYFEPPPLVFLRYLLNQCRYHHQTCSTLSPNNFTHCIKILKSRVL